MPWLMLLPVLLLKMLYHMGRCYCPFYYCSSWYDTTLHVLALIMAGVIAKWQGGTT